MHLVAVPAARGRAVVADRQRQEVEHEVRVGLLRVAAHEPAALEVVGGAGSPPQQPLQADPGAPPALQVRLHRHGSLAGVLHVHLEVVLQVLADSGQIGDDVDVQRPQQPGRTDAGELQQLGRTERPAAQDHAPASHGARAAAPGALHPHGAVALEDDAVDVGAAFDGQVRPAEHGVQVCPRRRQPPPPVDVPVEGGEALLAEAVEVGGQFVAGLLHRREEGREERARGRAPLQHQRAVAAPVLIGARQARLHALEVRQAVAVAPGLHALAGGPAVVVGRVAALEDHAVDGARPAQNLAAGVVDAATAHVRLGLGLELPVVEAIADGERQRRRHVDEDVPAPVAPPGLQDQHTVGGVRAQPVGQCAAGRAAPGDDEVVQLLLPGGGPRTWPRPPTRCDGYGSQACQVPALSAIHAAAASSMDIPASRAPSIEIWSAAE